MLKNERSLFNRISVETIERKDVLLSYNTNLISFNNNRNKKYFTKLDNCFKKLFDKLIQDQFKETSPFS